jgi:hypothetical protein
MIQQGKSRTQNKTYPNATFATICPTRTGLEVNLGLSDEKHPTDCMCHGVAYKFIDISVTDLKL